VRNVIIPLASAIILFLAGMLILNWQLWHMATRSSADAASISSRKIENMLAEAVSAAKTAQEVAALGCTRAGQLDLGTEAALKPHLRAIMIQQNDSIVCTSLPGNGLLLVPLNASPMNV